VSIDAETVRKLEALSALRLDDAARQRMVADLQRILGYMEQLAAIDVQGVEPTAHAAATGNVLRADAAAPSLPVAEMLANAPDVCSPFYRVPRFVGEAEAGA
jgi:aspartyl-tRNA(Asn)/glutamyl-tRNA(Gln) amidotransferase subunit C